MSNSELLTLDSSAVAYAAGVPARRPTPLAEARVGVAYAVRAIADRRSGALAQEGVVPGVTVVVEKRLPLGGPLVLRVGPARLALARGVARDVTVVEAKRR